MQKENNWISDNTCYALIRQSCKLSPEAAHFKAERNATRNAKTKKAFMQKKRENERLEMYNQLGIKPIKEDVSMHNSINVPI